MASKKLRALLPILVLGLAVFGTVVLVTTKPPPKRATRHNPGALVETVSLEAGTETLKVTANGNIIPSRQVVLAPEVAARVRKVHEELAAGAVFKQNEVLVRLDARDYALAVEQQKAAVDSARTELRIEKSRKEIAEREWELFGKGQSPDSGAEEGSLALRDPQLKTARAALASAQSTLERAHLAASKTVIRAPFNAMVQTESVEVGQIVGPNSPLMTLVGTDSYWVQVSIPVDQLPLIKLPTLGGRAGGSKVKVTQTVGTENIERVGRIVRLLGDVDPAGRMARLLVEIDDPLGLKSISDEARKSPLPLLLGAYVEVAITGKEVSNVIALSREALREGDKVYVFARGTGYGQRLFRWLANHSAFARAAHRIVFGRVGELAVEPVDVVWRGPESVFVKADTLAGRSIIVSPVPAPVPGMKLRVENPPAAGQQGDDARAARRPASGAGGL